MTHLIDSCVLTHPNMIDKLCQALLSLLMRRDLLFYRYIEFLQCLI